MQTGSNVKRFLLTKRHVADGHRMVEAYAKALSDKTFGRSDKLTGTSKLSLPMILLPEYRAKYWEAAGQAEAALAELSASSSMARIRLDTDAALDIAFEISSRVQGRTKAFEWLVLAQIARYGWLRWFTSRDEAEARLRTVAQQYRDRWREFLVSSSKSVLSRKEDATGIVVGLSRLVFFLLKVGETGSARACVMAMVFILKDELSEQPIRTPVWLQ